MGAKVGASMLLKGLKGLLSKSSNGLELNGVVEATEGGVTTGVGGTAGGGV